MNIRLIANTAGYILWVEAGFMLLPVVVSLIYGDGCWSAFLLCAAICAVIGTVLHFIKAKHTSLQNRDGYATVAIAWVLLSLFGALPYVVALRHRWPARVYHSQLPTVATSKLAQSSGHTEH